MGAARQGEEQSRNPRHGAGEGVPSAKKYHGGLSRAWLALKQQVARHGRVQARFPAISHHLGERTRGKEFIAPLARPALFAKHNAKPKA